MSQSLADWLERISRQHHQEIDLGLARCGDVMRRLNLSDYNQPVITVAGTNGKGSTVAYLDALARSIDMQPLTFTSPHLFDYRERLTYAGQWLSEEQHIEALSAITIAADEIPLTFFEFSTLCAFYWAAKLQPDLLILEVGLGGRLDATNLVAADIAIVTTVDLDHQEYLGNTIVDIAREKLGIVHPSTTLILADDTVPESCVAERKAKRILRSGSDYQIEERHWVGTQGNTLPLPEQIKPRCNAAAALCAFELLLQRSLSVAHVSRANQELRLAGRYQQINDTPLTILDVAHNPQAITHLVKRLESDRHLQVHILLGMMRDKNMPQAIALLQRIAKHWYFTDLDSPRAASAKQLSDIAVDQGISLHRISCYSSPVEAYHAAMHSLDTKRDVLVVVGSFLTVGPILEQVTN